MKKKKYDKNIFKHLIWIIHNIRKIDSKYIFISILATIINGIIPHFSYCYAENYKCSPSRKKLKYYNFLYYNLYFHRFI